MKAQFYFTISLLLVAALAWGSPAQTTPYIKIDQFGYLTASKKIAVIVDPQTGYNAAEAFAPSTGTNQYQLRRWSDDAIVFTGTIQAWGNGATHTQSGDRGWWFDFSAVTTAGSYYVFDTGKNVGSYRFDIGENVYDEALKLAIRMFYYQRLNYAKQVPYTDSKWADGASYEGATQDRYATSRFNKGVASTAKDLSGGWMDAGDVNKYTTFAESAVIQLAEAYRTNPTVFKDNYNIPESGNGIPDLLDELKYELDFLKRMQDATGTGGLFLKVGVDNYNEVSPISADTRPRYYLPECTSSTLAGAAMFAVAGQTFKTHSSLLTYGNDLIARAEAAWNRAKITTNNFTTFETTCDDGDIKSGDADRTQDEQLGSAFVAAVYLFEATGKAEYKTYVESKYTTVQPYSGNWWGPYWMSQHLAFLRYTTLSSATPAVVTNIRNRKVSSATMSLSEYTSATDLYRAYMPDAQHHWGSNQVRANCGLMNLDFVTYNVTTSNLSSYREVAEQYLHWLNGVNPMNLVMLTNMTSAGAENSVNEIYHTWFTNNTVWDNTVSSSAGPAPGYVTGGPNKTYAGTVANITNQPAQKAYKEWNNGYPENSWEITEPSIYNQAAYVMLLGRLINAQTAPPTDTQAPTAPTNLTASNLTQTSLTLAWTASSDNVGVSGYDVYQGTTLIGSTTTTSFNITGLTCATAYSFSVKAKDAAGNISAASNTASATTTACPDTQAPTIPTNLTASNLTQTSLTLAWTASSDNVGVTGYDVYQGTTLIGSTTTTSFNIAGLTCAASYSFSVKAKDAAGNISAASNTASATTTACALTAAIYTDALGSNWSDWSWSSTLNFAATIPVKVGTKSLRADYTAWGGVSLRHTTGITPNASTQLRFWIRSTTTSSYLVYVQTTDSGSGIGNYSFTATANTWQEVVLNLGQLGNPSTIKRVNIQNNSSQNVTAYFDEIRLVNVNNTRMTTEAYELEVTETLVYPNPSNGPIFVQYTSPLTETIQLRLMDISGREIQSHAKHAQQGRNVFELDLSSEKTGTYFIQLQGSNTTQTKKVSIQP